MTTYALQLAEEIEAGLAGDGTFIGHTDSEACAGALRLAAWLQSAGIATALVALSLADAETVAGFGLTLEAST